jgi:dihydroneopterin aldolase
MTIHIEELSFECIIGLLDFERITPQEVIVNLELEYAYEDEYINYADVAELIETTLVKNKYELIETALNELFNILSKAYPLIKKLHIKITKPNILPSCRVSVSNIKIF